MLCHFLGCYEVEENERTIKAVHCVYVDKKTESSFFSPFPFFGLKIERKVCVY